MGEGASNDWFSTLQANYREFINASEELRNIQLSQVAEQLASENDGAGLQGLPSLIQNPAAEPGAILPQFSSARLNDVLAYAVSLQVEHNEAVAQWTLAECIEAWARNSLGPPTIAPQKQEQQKAASTAAPVGAQPVLRSTVIKEAEPGAIKNEEQAAVKPGTTLPIPAAAMPAAYNPMFVQHLSAGVLQGGQALTLGTQLPAQQLLAAQQAGQLAGFLGMPQAYVNAAAGGVGVVEGDAIGQIISEAARKEAAAAARAARVAKRREEKQRKQERERKTKSAATATAAAAAVVAPPPQLSIPGQSIPVLAGGVMPVVTAPIAVPAAAGAAPQAAEPAPNKQNKSELRAIKNRESAARSRAKRVEYTSALEAQVEQLREQNKSLRGKVIAVAEAPPDPHAGKDLDGQPLRRTRTMPL